jgi:4-hydroxybenzoate polyprenyltransferase
VTVTVTVTLSTQDKADDAKVGVKSTALLFADKTKPILSGFGTFFITSLATTGYVAELGPAYYISVGAAAAHIAWQLLTVDLDKPGDCMAKFKSNTWVGAIITCGVILGRWFPGW